MVCSCARRLVDVESFVAYFWPCGLFRHVYRALCGQYHVAPNLSEFGDPDNPIDLGQLPASMYPVLQAFTIGSTPERGDTWLGSSCQKVHRIPAISDGTLAAESSHRLTRVRPETTARSARLSSEPTRNSASPFSAFDLNRSSSFLSPLMARLKLAC